MTFRAKSWVEPNIPKHSEERISEIVDVHVKNESDMSVATYKRIAKA